MKHGFGSWQAEKVAAANPAEALPEEVLCSNELARDEMGAAEIEEKSCFNEAF